MNKIYDNGSLMLGSIDDVINEIEKEIKEDIDMVYADKQDLLKELKDLKNKNIGVDIVYINYDRPMGYELNYWTKNNEIEECE